MTALDFRVVHVNGPTAAFSFLLLILGFAAKVGLQESIAASLASMLAYNFFFLPPIGTLTIADPQNWVALFVFLVTAITGSHLSSSARKKADEAASREREVQKLYEFSRALMLPHSARGLADQITQKISELFEVTDVALYDRQSDQVYRVGFSVPDLDDQRLREVVRTGAELQSVDKTCRIVPIRLGGPYMGSLGVKGSLSEIATKAVAQLVAIAFERARAEEVAARAEAAQQNEQLKSTLLDALAHEFKTPLTSIKAATSTILSRHQLNGTQQDLVTIVDEEADHLNNLVSEAIELARIGAAPVKLHRESCSLERVISSAVERLRRLSEGRVLDIRVDGNLPPISADIALIELALRQIVNNALKYSPPSSEISITAQADQDAIVVRTFNAGCSIPESEQNLIFEKFYRGRDVRTRVPGTGMGLTIAREIIEAHGGRIWLDNKPTDGVLFSFTLPIVSSSDNRRGQKVA